MERLTTNKNVSEMGMYELAHNCCYSNDGEARYRDFEMDMSARDFARNLMTTLTGDELSLDDDSFDEEILENLQYDPFADVQGLIALFYRNLWAMADLRETLKEYEDAEEKGLLLKLPCKVGDTVYYIDDYYVYSDRVKSIDIRKENGEYIFCIAYMDYKAEDFGRTVFLTKEEAEQKLEELKGE